MAVASGPKFRDELMMEEEPVVVSGSPLEPVTADGALPFAAAARN